MFDSMPDNKTPADIAARVTKSGRHLSLDERLGELREAEARITDEIRALIAAKNGSGGQLDKGLDQSIRKADNSLKPIEKEMREIRTELAPLREAHGQKVRLALSPLRKDAARDMVAALEALSNAAAVVGECDELARRAGAAVAPTMINIRALAAAALRFAAAE